MVTKFNFFISKKQFSEINSWSDKHQKVYEGAIGGAYSYQFIVKNKINTNIRVVTGLYRDELSIDNNISILDEKIEKLSPIFSNKFLDEKEISLLENFLNKFSNNESFMYQFTQTSLGTTVRITCLDTNDFCDITNYDIW